MSLTPCIITHIKTGKVVSVNEALEIVRQDPKLWEKAMKGEEKAKDPFIAKLEALKFGKGTVGLNAGIWDTAIDIVIAAYQAGKAIAEAVQEGVKYLQKNGATDQEIDDFYEKVGAEKPVKIGGETKERKTITSIKEAVDVSDDVKEALGGERTRYEVLPNEISVKEANAILNALGEVEAKALVLNGSGKIPGAFRTTLAQVLIKSFNASGQYDQAVNVAEGIAEMATDWGQAVQALSLFGYLTPEGQLLAAQRAVDAQVEKKFKEHKPKMDKIKKELKKANEEAIDEALDKVEGRVKNQPVPKRPLSYGEKNKIVTRSAYEKAKKGLKNFAFSGVPPELVTIAAYHVEAGARTFAEFSKEMVKDFGRKVKPHLKAAYKAASKQLGGTGYSSDTEIAEYFASDLEKDVAQAMKDSGIEIQKVIRSHYTEVDAAKKTLTDKLIERLGLDPSDAATIAGAVEVEFNKIAKEKKEKAIAKAFSPMKRKSSEVKALQDKLIELSNLGAFDEAQFKEAYAEAMGFPKLTPENAAEIKRLAELAQNAKEGLPKFRATEDLLKYQAKIKGADWYEVPMAIWMSSILSGMTTQVKNLTANAFNTFALLSNVAAQNPKNIPFIMKGLAVGVKKGFLEGQDVLRTGYSPIRDKAQVPDILERTEFKGGKYNPYNYYKYVRRFMVASDVLAFEGLKEMRAYQLALSEASNNFPDMNAQQKALETLNSTSDAIALATDRAEAEFKEVAANIQARTDLTDTQKAKEIAQAEADKKRRVYEFIEEMRPNQMVSEAHDFAERGTYNNKPDGILGVLAQGVNQLAYRAPLLRLIVPFTNVITNVANETVNYSPIGFWRAQKQGSITGNRKEFSEQQKTDLMYKATMGTLAAIVVYALASIGGDDDEPLLEITADGYNDFKKNKDLEASGWKPYSIKIGNKWVSYKLSPLVFILSTIGALKDFEKYRDGKVDDDALTKWSAAFQEALSSITETTFLPSVENFISALVDKKGEGRIDAITQWAAKTGGSGVPVFGTGLYQQLVLLAQEKLDIPDKEYRQTYFGKMLRTIPVARGLYENSVNGLGEELPQKQSQVLVGSARNGETQKLWGLIAKNRVSTGSPDRKGASWINETGQQKPMTDAQFYQFAKARGEYIRKRMEDDYDAIAKMNQDDFREWFSAVRSKANSYGNAAIDSGAKKREGSIQKAAAILNPTKEAQQQAKEQIRLAIDVGDTEMAMEGIRNLGGGYAVVKEVLKSTLDENSVAGRIGVKEGMVDEFYKILQNQRVDATTQKKREIVGRMQQIAKDPILTESIKNKLGLEYATALRSLQLVGKMGIKTPSKPRWMEKYEQIVLK